MHPDEGRYRGDVDARTVKVAARRGNDAAHEQANDNGRRLHDRRPEALAEHNGDEDGEAEAKELGGAPGQRVRRAGARAKGKDARGGGRVGAGPGAAQPALEAALDEVHADEHDGRPRDDGRAHAQEDARGDKGDEDLDEGAQGRRADEGAVAARAGQRLAVGGGRAVAVGVHLLEAAESDGDETERGANDGDDPCANVVSVFSALSVPSYL